ncbi:MAG: nickel pincer cofactor biosynthesis protein LarC [Candidatus Limnocylindrales bacterium]
MKVAFADCFSGISGDMFLAALLDAGLPLDTLREGIEGLGLPEKVELRLTETHKGALRAADLEVVVPDSRQHRGLSDVLGIVSGSRLSDGVKGTAARIFTLLAEAEARVHGESVDQVHFHEVGALDSVVDVVGAAIGLDALGIERLYASPLPYGSGTVESQHGPLPLPAPATLELLRLAHAPLTPSSAQVELVTPTGAAILAALAVFERPDLTIASVGVGAGKRDLPWPNVMRLMVGEVPADGATEMVQLETNIDDMNPQFYGHVMDKLMAAGARDVFLTPIQMKKNRPGTLLGVIACRRDEAALAELILRETTTLGLRVQPIGRFEATRELRQVETAYGTLTVKLKILDGKVVQSVPEYDDCVRLADENGVSLAEVYRATHEALMNKTARHHV